MGKHDGRVAKMKRIAKKAGVSTRTVRRYLDGNNVLPIVETAIVAAAKSLSIPLKLLRRQA